MFQEKDVALIEVNPLVITPAGHLHCLDAKVAIDGNALYRHPDLREMHDPTQEDEREAHAANWELNYVALDGNIGCMVNGAGLDRKSTRLNSSHVAISYAVFCLKKKTRY